MDRFGAECSPVSPESLWHAIARAVAKPHDNGKLTTVCTANWKEKEQEWASLQLVSTAAVVKYLCNTRRTGIHSLFNLLGREKGVKVRVRGKVC